MSIALAGALLAGKYYGFRAQASLLCSRVWGRRWRGRLGMVTSSTSNSEVFNPRTLLSVQEPWAGPLAACVLQLVVCLFLQLPLV